MSDTDAPQTSAQRGGRPRDPELDEAIIIATRRRLVEDGYSRMNIGDIATDAGVTRPTVYRRWPGKFDLVMDALDWGFRAQRNSYPTTSLEDVPPQQALTEAIKRLDPCYFNPDAMVLMGNFMAEVRRTPELLAMVCEHAVEPRVRLLEGVLSSLQERGHVRDDVDVRTISTMCFGAYFAAFLRNDDHADGLAERLSSTIWPAIAVPGDAA
ncbi:TetR/AcrR family transcriptional regulator [Nocardioides sp. LHG3406-4]|uniref:TetR/AcrR family transcriptional regulator n=1 Tax=Nocardioides sp. LHG3406-4 TaxID=2804575 RepID=UPI003CEAE633